VLDCDFNPGLLMQWIGEKGGVGGGVGAGLTRGVTPTIMSWCGRRGWGQLQWPR
jgi:hypothetical protein